MKIIELRAENVKRLRAVEITPDGSVQVIGGRNAQGKSSVLDAIWLALGGGKASKETPLPIRHGEEKASVRLDLGELIVTRSWTHKTSTLKVENAEGATFKSPQSMLDALVGQLSFDPLAFTRLSPKEQREALLGLVDLGIDLDALDQQIRETFENRTRIGREGKALGEVSVDESLPTEETSAAALLANIQEIQEANDRRAALEREEARWAQECRDTQAEIQRLQQVLAAAEESFKKAQEGKAAHPEFRPLEPLREQLSTIEDVNQRIRANNAARSRKQHADDLRAQYEAATGELKRLESVKADALKAAKFPVEGLSFDESGVLYRGVPLSQASSAEQIRVSLAMGMALNPKLKVLMIKDGSLLDDESMAAIHEQVAEKDYQLLIERVGNADQGAVIIEDGMVA